MKKIILTIIVLTGIGVTVATSDISAKEKHDFRYYSDECLTQNCEKKQYTHMNKHNKNNSKEYCDEDYTNHHHEGKHQYKSNK